MMHIEEHVLLKRAELFLITAKGVEGEALYRKEDEPGYFPTRDKF